MFEINTIKLDYENKTSFIKVNENTTHILEFDFEFKGGTPIIGIYDITFNIITIPDYIDADIIDGIEYKIIYIYKIKKVRWKQWTH